MLTLTRVIFSHLGSADVDFTTPTFDWAWRDIPRLMRRYCRSPIVGAFSPPVKAEYFGRTIWWSAAVWRGAGPELGKIVYYFE